MENSLKFILIFLLALHNFESCYCMIWGAERGGDQCDAAIKETALEDRATEVNGSPNRLHGTWMSQECETRTGPEYVIRKYTFYENGTFLLTRFHYAEDSCTIPTHTVAATGAIKLLSPSLLVPGATEARYHLENVYITPLNRQVAYKLEHRVNITCSRQAKWRPYTAQLIYMQYLQSLNNHLWEEPRYMFQEQQLSRNRRGVNCLEPLGIDFGELKLLRVHRKPYIPKSMGFAVGKHSRMEMLLGSLPTSVHSKKNHRSTSLQSQILLHSDTSTSCPICSAINRSTINSPPLLHEAASLPALIGGSWLSSSCESFKGGLWLRRKLQVHPGDKLWSGQWDYYADSYCSVFLYAVSAAGSYVQRGSRQRRQTDFHPETFRHSNSRSRRNTSTPPKDFIQSFLDTVENFCQFDVTNKVVARYSIVNETVSSSISVHGNRQSGFRKPEEETGSSGVWYREVDCGEGQKMRKRREGQGSKRLLRKRRNADFESLRDFLPDKKPSVIESFGAMLRGNPRKEENSGKGVFSLPPLGTTELDLHVAESLLVPADFSVAIRCGSDITGRLRPMASWPRNCVPHVLEAPSTLGLRARVSVDWNGQYTLLLGKREDYLWDAPLLQCGPAQSHNSELRAQLQRSVGLRYGFLASTSSGKFVNTHLIILTQMFCCVLYILIR